MKSTTILILIVLGFALPTQAQDKGFHFGTKIAVGRSTVSTEFYQSNPDAKLNFQAGGSSLFMFSSFFGLRTDVLFNYTHFEGQGTYTYGDILNPNRTGTFEDNIQLFNLQVPISFHAQLGKGNFHPYVDLGLAPNVQMFGVQNREYDNTDYNDENGIMNEKLEGSNIFSSSTVLGVGLSASNDEGKAYFLELQWMKGISPMGKLEQGDRSNNYRLDQVNIAFGYFF